MEPLVVSEIISNTALIIQESETLTTENIEGRHVYKIMPKVNQATIYKKCWDVLGEEGGCIGIFPEVKPLSFIYIYIYIYRVALMIKLISFH